MMMNRVRQRLLARVATALVRRRRQILLIGGLALVGLVGSAFYNALSAPSMSESAATTYIPTVPGEPRSTAAFIRARQTYDAKLAWSSLNDALVRELGRRGQTVEDEQRRMDGLRQSGSRIDSAHYVGGYSIPNGRSIHFYVIQSSGGRAGTDHQPFVFTLDSAGKIESIQ
jgi:hypothetical protein